MPAFILFFAVLQLVVAVSNLIFRQPLPKNRVHSNPLVSVLIPARNEGKNIGNLLTDLIRQNYSNLEILVFDDQSTDNTAQIVTDFVKKDTRIQLIKSTGLPNGWLGKNFACSSLATKATGNFYLFLDADVRIRGSIIEKTISFSKKHNLGLLSIFPQQIMKSTGEYVTVPNMNFILLSLLPLVLVRKSRFSSLSTANGQFMLFSAEAYRHIKPHEVLKQEKVEDIKTARLFKKEKIKIASLSGIEEISCRMYNGFTEAINGFSKNVIQFFGGSAFLAIFFWLITTWGFLVIIFTFPGFIFWSYLGILVLTRLFVSLASKQSSFRNIILLVPQQMALGIIIYSAIINLLKKQLEWKGRNIPV